MNWSRVRHLLGFEWLRVRRFVFVAWLGLILAFAPRLAGGIMVSERYGYDELCSGLGWFLFGLSSFFALVRLGLQGRGWRDARPLVAVDMGMVRLIIVGGFLVVPVLLLNGLSLWLHGFSQEVIWSGIVMNALGVIPLFIGWWMLVSYAERIRVFVVGLVVLFIIIFIGRAMTHHLILMSWIDVLGSWSSWAMVAGSWTAVILFLIGVPFVKRWEAQRKMMAAVVFVVAGWMATHWVQIHSWRWVEEMSLGIHEEGGTDRGIGLDYELRNHIRPDGTILMWGRCHEIVNRSEDLDFGELNRQLHGGRPKRIKQEWLSKELFDGEGYFVDEGGNIQVMQEFEPHDRVKPAGENSGQEELVTGYFETSVIKMEKVVDLAYREDGEFALDDTKGNVRWSQKLTEKKAIQELVVAINVLRFYSQHERVQMRWGGRNFIQDWVVAISYPKSKVLVEGRVRLSESDTPMGGVGGFHGEIEFDLVAMQQRGRLSDETPRLVIYRPRIVRSGYRKASIPMLMKKDRGNMGYADLGFSHQNDLKAHRSFMEKRPDPEETTKEEVAWWTRQLGRSWRESGESRIRDLAEFSGDWGELHLKIGARPQFGGSYILKQSVVLGARDELGPALIESLGDVPWAPSVAVSRGWDQAGKDRLRQLIKDGTEDESVMRMAMKLGMEEAKISALEKLSRDGSFELYRVVRGLSGIEKDLDQAIQLRAKLVEQSIRREGNLIAQGRTFDLNRWRIPLMHGKRNFLRMFFECVHRNAKIEGRELGFGYSDEIFLLRDQKKVLPQLIEMEAEDFVWDPVIRRWIETKKGERK